MLGIISHEMIKPFSGKGDVAAWLRKVRLVANLQNIVDLASLIPLYLEGNALVLYLEMNECKKTDIKKIEDRLKEAFMEGVFEFYNKLSWSS